MKMARCLSPVSGAVIHPRVPAGLQVWAFHTGDSCLLWGLWAVLGEKRGKQILKSCLLDICLKRVNKAAVVIAVLGGNRLETWFSYASWYQVLILGWVRV